jgi:hypothetical protein
MNVRCMRRVLPWIWANLVRATPKQNKAKAQVIYPNIARAAGVLFSIFVVVFFSLRP